jgi:O-antigen/teichoic acid export membrane protein
LAIQRQAQFIRNQRFGIVAWASVASTLFSYIVAIVLAYLGLGIWSLILSLLARNAASTAIVILASSWIPCKYKKEPSTGRHLRFGSDVFKFDVINYLSRNIDNVVIGKFYGDQWLGVYSRAYQAMLFPIIQCRGPIVSAGMPALSKVSGDTSDHWESFMWIVRTVASLCIPLAASIYLFKYELINSILGPKWVDSALIIGYLTPAAVVQATGGLLGLYLLSLGKSSKYLTWGAGYSAVTVISILVGAVFGTNEVAKAYSIGQLILFFPSIWFCFEGDRRKMKQFTAASVWPILSCILAAIASKMCFINVADRLGVRISLIAGMSVFVVVYGALYIANEKRLRCLL